MLVPFVIDADSIAPDPAWTPAQLRACFNGLFNVWQQTGLLTHDGNSLAGSRLFEAIKSLPQAIRSQWQELLERSPLLSAAEWNGVVSKSTLANFSTVAQLAIVDDTRAEIEFGFDDTCDELALGSGSMSVSVCRFLAAAQASAFREAIAQMGSHIEAGTTFTSIWNERFDSLAKAPIKIVSIVDRYAIEQHLACGQTKLSGLERFLRMLDESATGPRHVSIYSAWTSALTGTGRRSIDEIAAELKIAFGRLSRRRVQRVKIFMVPNSGFRDDGHDRFVRFDGYVWDIGLGLEVLEGAFAAKRSSAGFKSGTAVAGYKTVERDLQGNSKADFREIC